ncbi:hypothetical protein [Dactylosporangium darangshiense]|uniref:hypothetical protein n=1 Tax=Dactylosporangium darangshiense TaxID=579108 RepID=UPI0036328F09
MAGRATPWLRIGTTRASWCRPVCARSGRSTGRTCATVARPSRATTSGGVTSSGGALGSAGTGGTATPSFSRVVRVGIGVSTGVASVRQVPPVGTMSGRA